MPSTASSGITKNSDNELPYNHSSPISSAYSTRPTSQPLTHEMTTPMHVTIPPTSESAATLAPTTWHNDIDDGSTTDLLSAVNTTWSTPLGTDVTVTLEQVETTTVTTSQSQATTTHDVTTAGDESGTQNATSVSLPQTTGWNSSLPSSSVTSIHPTSSISMMMSMAPSTSPSPTPSTSKGIFPPSYCPFDVSHILLRCILLYF